MRACPRCGDLMVEVRLERRDGPVLVDRCPMCLGAYFDFDDGTPGLLARDLLLEMAGAAGRGWTAPVAGATCPDCGEPMLEHRDISEVFRCENCWSVFCPASALSSLAAPCAVLDPVGSPGFLERIVDFIAGGGSG